jgi:hypothetical protein
MNRRSNYTSIVTRALAILAVIAISLSAFAQLPGVGGVANYAPPFDMVGFLQDAGLGAPPTPGVPGQHLTFSSANRTQSGWMSVNDHAILVPQNTVLQMPATSMTWADLFDPAGAAAGVTAGGIQTGMALADVTPKLAGTYEIHVQGNIINGQYIAGLIFIAPQSLNIGNGFVSHIDYNTGDIYVNGGPGGVERRLQINDPIGRFGKAHSPDQRFTIDEDNPTIHANTGYPMCVPRSDPAVQPDNLCPEINRPKNPLGGWVMNFTMPDPAVRLNTDPDAGLMAPFEVGDYLTYSGMLVPDSTQASGYYISVYNIDNNVGIYTAPLADPVYVVMGEFLQGTGGVANIAFPQETTSKVKVEGMSTDSDPRRTVDIAARDTDCNGIVTERAPWIAGFPIDPGPPTGAKRGRIRWRPNGGPFLPPAKEIMIVESGANTSKPTKNGLFPGQYYAPEFAFIFPEGLAAGDPPITLNFSDFVWLVNGIGPFGNVNIGQLSPFPDLNAPVATCSFNATLANAVVTADAGGPYTLQLASSGSGSVALASNPATGVVGPSFSVPAGATPTFRWTILNQQPAGQPQLTLSANNVLNPTVSISGLATITAPITFQLSLVVTNNANPQSPSQASVTTVTVMPPVQPPIVQSLTLSAANVATGGAFSATALGLDPGGLSLTYTFAVSGPAGCATVLGTQPQASNVGSFTAVGTIAPPATSLSCTVSASATNSAGVTSAPATATVVIKAPAGNPTITSIKATPNPVVSNGTVALSAVASDPNNLALTYKWTILNANGTTFATLTGATPTFTAPATTPAAGPITLSISLTVTNSNGQTATSAPLALTVNPPAADVLANNGTLYRTSKSRLTVNVTSSVVSPSIVLTAVLDTINPATGLHYTATLQNLGGGAYTVDFIGVGLPNTINVTSTGGGSITITQAQITVRQ